MAVVVVAVVDAPKVVPRADALMAVVRRVDVHRVDVRRVEVRSVISPAHAVEAVAADSHCGVRSLSARHDSLSFPWLPAPALTMVSVFVRRQCKKNAIAECSDGENSKR